MGGWRAVGWLVSSGEARGSWLEAAQLCGGGVCHVERQLDLKSLPLDCYMCVCVIWLRHRSVSDDGIGTT